MYWLAHVYVGLHGRPRRRRRREHPGTGSPPAPATRPACSRAGSRPSWSTWSGTLLGLSAGNAAAVAVYFSVGLLVCVGYVAAHLAGRTGAAALVDASIAGLFGVAVVVLKALLH